MCKCDKKDSVSAVRRFLCQKDLSKVRLGLQAYRQGEIHEKNQ